ncbi:hypothetical protein BIFDEN_02227 [Bifidobacterium dentium ATCC 27678]|nr:hypothetical protein BIFDEN_02227 [Bifidobacterium dentium ATCC 27678]
MGNDRVREISMIMDDAYPPNSAQVMVFEEYACAGYRMRR